VQRAAHQRLDRAARGVKGHELAPLSTTLS
jgi:hypothetical protein